MTHRHSQRTTPLPPLNKEHEIGADQMEEILKQQAERKVLKPSSDRLRPTSRSTDGSKVKTLFQIQIENNA